MNIIIDAELSEPPSSINCFRDVTLYVACFMDASVLVQCSRSMKDLYYHWLKDHGAYDFIDAIVRNEEEKGFTIGHEGSNIMVDRITAHNLNIIINRLNSFRKK